jgi:hypothetical protein
LGEQGHEGLVSALLGSQLLDRVGASDREEEAVLVAESDRFSGWAVLVFLEF